MRLKNVMRATVAVVVAFALGAVAARAEAEIITFKMTGLASSFTNVTQIPYGQEVSFLYTFDTAAVPHANGSGSEYDSVSATTFIAGTYVATAAFGRIITFLNDGTYYVDNTRPLTGTTPGMSGPKLSFQSAPFNFSITPTAMHFSLSGPALLTSDALSSTPPDLANTTGGIWVFHGSVNGSCCSTLAYGPITKLERIDPCGALGARWVVNARRRTRGAS